MSGFDEWLSSDDCDVDAYSNPYDSARSAFKAGAQSRQAEIDELQAMYEKQGLYAFELQKRINKAIEVFEEHDLNHIDKIEKVYGILKGNQNEN